MALVSFSPYLGLGYYVYSSLLYLGTNYQTRM